jgi:hypothetical protein
LETIHPPKKSFYKDFVEITKARLAISVVFSTIAGYLLGIDSWSSHNWEVLFLLAIGGYCMVGASNVFNQIIEKDLDALMDRTKNRPLPSERMSKQTAFIFGSILTNRVGHYLESNFTQLATTNPAALKDFDMSRLDGISENTAALDTLPPEIKSTALEAFVSSFHIVFYAAAPITALGFLLALQLREMPLRTNKEYAEAKQDAVGDSLG